MWNVYLTADPMSPHTWDWSIPRFDNNGCGLVTFYCLFFALHCYHL